MLNWKRVLKCDATFTITLWLVGEYRQSGAACRSQATLTCDLGNIFTMEAAAVNKQMI